MEYRLDKVALLDRLSVWNGFLKRRIHLIACGGTALTLLGVKSSTKDVDLIVPNIDEHEYLLDILKQLGYRPASGSGWARGDGFIFDLFSGKRVHTTELLDSPVKEGKNIFVKEFSYIYLGVLNYYDILTTKLFRAASIDIDDCMALIKAKSPEIDIEKFTEHFRETASFDVSEEKVNKNLEHFLRLLKKEGFKW